MKRINLDVLRMAREAGMQDCTCNGTLGCLERFAELVRADSQRTWVELTDEEVDRALDAAKVPELPGGYESVELEIARAIEAKLKEKNT